MRVTVPRAATSPLPEGRCVGEAMNLEPDPQKQTADLDRRMMFRALDLAREAAAMGEVPVGAVVYRHGQVLAEAFNRRESDNDPVGHAEILALRQAALRLGDWRLSDCSLAVTLEPCAMCAGAIVNSRIGRLVYGARDPKMGAVESLYRLCSDARMNHEPESIVAGLMAEECGRLLSGFFQQRRNENSK